MHARAHPVFAQVRCVVNAHANIIMYTYTLNTLTRMHARACTFHVKAARWTH